MKLYGQDFKYRVVDWHYQYYMGPKDWASGQRGQFQGMLSAFRPEMP